MRILCGDCVAKHRLRTGRSLLPMAPDQVALVRVDDRRAQDRSKLSRGSQPRRSGLKQVGMPSFLARLGPGGVDLLIAVAVENDRAEFTRRMQRTVHPQILLEADGVSRCEQVGELMNRLV